MAAPERCPTCGVNHADLLTRNEVDVIVDKTVRRTLLTMGIDSSDPIEMQRDFQALREWRSSLAFVKSNSMKAVVGVSVVGLLGLLWIGIQYVFGRHP